MAQFASPHRDLVERREREPHVDMAPAYVACQSRQSRWTFPPSALGWIVLTITWPLLEIALDQRLVDDWTAVVVLLTLHLLPVGLLLADPNSAPRRHFVGFFARLHRSGIFRSLRIRPFLFSVRI